MRKLVFLIPVLLFFYSCSERPNIVIEGKIQNGAREMLYLDFLDINQTRVIDSLKIRKDDSFKMKFYSEYPGIYLLRNKSGKIINLLPFPGESLFIETEYNKFSSGYTVSGSQESEHLRQLVEKLHDTRNKIKDLNTTYESFSSLTEEQAAKYIQQLKAINKEQRDFSIQFIIEHMNSIASIYALYQEISDGQYVLGENFDIQYMKIVADSVSKYYPDVPFVESFVTDARNSEKKVENLKTMRKKLEEAEIVGLDINLPGTDEKPVSLSSINNKTVLLYFWSTKSEDSRQLNPSLKKTYDKYREKGFEIYAVAIENNKKEWTDALKYDELDWINVYENTYPNSKAAGLYNVKILPSTFLINKSGDVVARNIFGNELEKWLDNIL